MACTEFHYYSRVLDIDVTVSVILPEVKTMLEQDGKPLPTRICCTGSATTIPTGSARPGWSFMPGGTGWRSSCPASTVPSIRI